MSKAAKPKVALYWASSCGGCEIAVLELHEKILDVAAAVDIVFWPVAIDTKYKDVEAMPDQSIDLCLFNGAIRTSENEHLAQLLRRKSKILVAFGSCAYEGCIPALANLTTKKRITDFVYQQSPSTIPANGNTPREETQVEEGTLNLPSFYECVKALDQVVEVDYYLPGCAPTPEHIWGFLELVLNGELPPRGTVYGTSRSTVCDDCTRVRKEKKVSKFYRPYEIIPNTSDCLLEQGLLCAGIATRGGCGALCIRANMPCRGCFGPPGGVVDQGAKFISAIASAIDADDPEKALQIMNQIPDISGYAWRFSLSHALLGACKPLLDEEKAMMGR